MNKLIVVTGGTKGIGRAIAEKFAAEGFDLIIAARNQADLATMKEIVEKERKVSVLSYVADLSDKAQTLAFTRYVEGLDRPVDVLVNNAGYFIPGKVTEEEDGVLESMINGNVYSAYRVTRGLLPALKKKRGSHIFNMCSIASFMAYPNGGSYTISKFALLGFSKVLREELKPDGIRVTSLMPGATMSASWEGVNVQEDRLMKAADIAETVFAAWSLSERSVIEEIVIRPQLGDL